MVKIINNINSLCQSFSGKKLKVISVKYENISLIEPDVIHFTKLNNDIKLDYFVSANKINYKPLKLNKESRNKIYDLYNIKYTTSKDLYDRDISQWKYILDNTVVDNGKEFVFVINIEDNIVIDIIDDDINLFLVALYNFIQKVNSDDYIVVADFNSDLWKIRIKSNDNKKEMLLLQYDIIKSEYRFDVGVLKNKEMLIPLSNKPIHKTDSFSEFVKLVDIGYYSKIYPEYNDEDNDIQYVMSIREILNAMKKIKCLSIKTNPDGSIKEIVSKYGDTPISIKYIIDLFDNIGMPYKSVLTLTEFEKSQTRGLQVETFMKLLTELYMDIYSDYNFGIDLICEVYYNNSRDF